MRRPSPVFVALVVTLVAGGWVTWTGWGNPDIGVFVFVAAGWLVSLCLHEFAHAYVAYRSGDRSVVERGLSHPQSPALQRRAAEHRAAAAVCAGAGRPRAGTQVAFWSGVAFLVFLQVTAILLSLLPIPGLDGYGMVEPWLPRRWGAGLGR
jgi:Zn-dependent protease